MVGFFQILHPNLNNLMNPPGAMSDGSDDSEEVLMAMSTLQEEGVMAVKQVGELDLNLVAWSHLLAVFHFIHGGLSWRINFTLLHLNSHQ